MNEIKVYFAMVNEENERLPIQYQFYQFKGSGNFGTRIYYSVTCPEYKHDTVLKIKMAN